MRYRPDAGPPVPMKRQMAGQLEGGVVKWATVSIGALAIAVVTPGLRGLLLVAVSGFTALGSVGGIIELRSRGGGE